MTRCDVGQVTSIDTLPDDVLLGIFDFYLYDAQVTIGRERAWQLLVHVCRRWRCTVFGFPRQLNLQLVCAGRTRARDTLDVWPALPLVIQCEVDYPIRNVDNIIAVLERRDRVCQISLIVVRSSDLEIFLAAMQQPFPELTRLELKLFKQSAAAFPDSLLGGSATRLEYLMLKNIPFPGLPKLLLSATHLVNLTLRQIPHSGYISPDAMVAALSALTSLESLTLVFQSPRSCPNRETRHPSSSTRSILPVLTFFRFKGVSEYLEDLVACIDTPRLLELSITFFNDVVFDTPQFMQFINRTPMLTSLEKAHITLWNKAAYVNFSSPTSGHGSLNVEILCSGLNWQVSAVEQVCTSCLPSLWMSEDLYMYERPGWRLEWKEKIENGLWVELLHPFTALKNLYLCEEFERRIGPALQELVEGRTTEVMPTLQNIFLEGLGVEEGIRRFVAARRVAGHPITISRWVNSGMEMIISYYVDE